MKEITTWLDPPVVPKAWYSQKVGSTCIKKETEDVCFRNFLLQAVLLSSLVYQHLGFGPLQGRQAEVLQLHQGGQQEASGDAKPSLQTSN